MRVAKVGWFVVQGLTSNQTHYRLFQRRVFCKGIVAVILNRNFSLRFGSVNQFESIFPSLVCSEAPAPVFGHFKFVYGSSQASLTYIRTCVQGCLAL